MHDRECGESPIPLGPHTRERWAIGEIYNVLAERPDPDWPELADALAKAAQGIAQSWRWMLEDQVIDVR